MVFPVAMLGLDPANELLKNANNKKRWKVRGSCVHVRLEIIVLFLFWQTAAVQSF